MVWIYCTRCLPHHPAQVYFPVMHRIKSTKADGRTTRHQERRPELLRAVTDHVLANGFASLSLRATAKALGVTHSTLLRHFGSKERLIVAIIEEVCADLVQRATEPVLDLTIPTDQILRGVWQQLCKPKEQRQFIVLFELVSLSIREPEGAVMVRIGTDYRAPP